MNEATTERVSASKSDAIMGVILTMTEGPREAYGLLALCIWRLNFEFNSNAVNIDELCAEVTQSLRSIRKGIDQ